MSRSMSFLTAAAVLLAAGCGKASTPIGAAGDAAARVYVAPGQHDELYAFMSGGFSGNVTVYGLPSGRLLQQIAVFSQYPEKGYGYSEQTKAMFNTSYGFVPWDDAHHPQLSITNGQADGRWLFINGNNTPRIARISLTTFETEEIIEIPNSSGGHGSPYLTENSEYAVSATRFALPTPQEDVSIRDGKFGGMLSFVKIDPASGHMNLAFQILVPGYDYDLARSGKGPSKDWSFFTSYNSEEAKTLLEANASQKDRDYIAAVNRKAAERFGGSGERALLSLLNVVLLLLPLVTVVFGTLYVYNAREFIETLLAQPVGRGALYTGLFAGLAVPLGGAFLLGVGVPLLLLGGGGPAFAGQAIMLLSVGLLLTLVFTAFSLCVAVLIEDRARGLGAALFVWLLTTLIYDGLILLVTTAFDRYPLEGPLLGLMFLNPVDLGRVLLLLSFDVSALMGYTGAVYQRFFDGREGVLLALLMLVLCAAVPFLLGLHWFRRKDF